MPIQAAIPFRQLLTVVAVPTLMIFIGILLNRQDYRSLDTKIGQLHNGVGAKIGQLHNDMIMAHSILREFEGRLGKLESRP
jgi:hypothetical protein